MVQPAAHPFPSVRRLPTRYHHPLKDHNILASSPDNQKRRARTFRPLLRRVRELVLPLLPANVVVQIAPRRDARDADVTVELLYRIEERAVVVGEKDMRRVLRVEGEPVGDR